MQLSSAYQPLVASAGSPGVALPATINPSGLLDGISVSVVPTIKAFFSSLSPAYGLDNRRQKSEFTVTDVAKSSGSPDKTGDTAQKIKFACNVLSSWAPSVRVVTDVVTTICSSLSLAQDLGQVLDGQKAYKRLSTSAATSVTAGAALTLVALDNLTGAAAVGAHGERGSPQNPILVHNSEILSKIGQDENYPASAYYRQNDSFSHEIKRPGALFSGHYDGGCHTISGLEDCLFSEIGRHGVVRNLRLDNINVNITIDYGLKDHGVLACIMSPFSTARNIQVERAEVRVHADSYNPVNLDGTGALVGRQHHSSLITDVDLRNCTVVSTGNYIATGALGGRIEGKLEGVNVSHCQVNTHGNESPAGIGAGQLQGQIKDLAVTDSRAETRSFAAPAGIGAGWIMPGGTIKRMSVKNCRAITEGRFASAGIGGGVVIGDLEQFTVVDSRVETTDSDGFAGIAGGQVGGWRHGNLGRVSTMTLVHSDVLTKGEEAHAGLIAGWLHGAAKEITSVDCEVDAYGVNTITGVGVGINDGEIDNFISVRDRVQNRDNTSGRVAGVNRVPLQGFSLQDTMVDGQLETVNPLANLSGLCANADPRLVDSNCLTGIPAKFSWQCASAPAVSPCGSVWLPIEVNNEETINGIGRSARYPSDAHYVQTSDLDGTRLNGNSPLVFDGHYDGRNHIIRNQHTCLFDTLRGTVRNLQLTDARITAYGKDAAVVACKMDDGGMVEDIWIGNSSVTTRGPALAGLVSARRTGELNWVSRIEIHNSSVETHADAALAGAVAGQCHGVTEQVDVHHTRVKTRGADAHAALGGGTVRGKLTSFAATCSQVETNGFGARAGMGAGVLLADGLIEEATVVNGSVHTTEDGSDAGVGAGQIEKNSELRKINALYTKLHTAGKSASAGVGAGRLVEGAFVTDVTGFESEVATTGARSDAGFGVGIIDANSDGYRLADLRSAYNVIKTTANSSRASMTGNLAAGGSAIDPYPITVDTFINSVFKNDSVTQYTLDTFCDYADRRLVAWDCHINRTALPGNCAPIQFASPPNLTTPSAVCNFSEPAEVTVRPSVSTSSPGNQTQVQASVQPLSVTVPVPVSVQPVTVTVPVSVPPLTVTASVPLVAGLSTATTVGIAVAATFFVIGAGIAACCYYRSRCHTEEPKKENEESDYLWDL